jgi:Uma2 family endonuclease
MSTTVLGVPLLSQSLMEDLARVGRRHDRWSVQAYFELDGNYLVEYCRGRLEILPMPAIAHQRIAQRLNTALVEFITRHSLGGEVLFAGTRVKVAENVFREPDVLYIPPEAIPFVQEEFVERIGLAMEVVSESNREHDLQTKREEYALAGIPEYWIVDPQENQITVLTLTSGRYELRGEFKPGDRAASAFLAGFEVDVAAVFVAP